MRTKKITKDNHTRGIDSPNEAVVVRGRQWNDLVDDMTNLFPDDNTIKITNIEPQVNATGVIINNVQIIDGVIRQYPGISFMVPYVSSNIPSAITTVAGAVQTAVFTEAFYTGVTTGAGGTNTIALQAPWVGGQLRKIELVVDNADLVVTIADGGNIATATFADAGDYILLLGRSDGQWQLIENHGCVITE
jgi:hypothetical protein